MSEFSLTAPARMATRLAFFAAGFAMACLAPLFPFIKSNVAADEALFGLLLLGLGLGSIIAMPVTGIIAARKGARMMVLLGGVGLVITLPLVAVSTTPLALAFGLFLFGASLGTIDVAMNVHGAEIEARENRPLMSNFHAQFSIGGFFGAGLMTVLLTFGVSFTQAAFIGALVVLAAMSLTPSRLLTARSDEPAPFAFPRGIVLLLALLAAVTFLVEGAMLDWGALLIIELSIAPDASAGIGYIIFSVAMVFARLTGDRTVAAFGALRVLIFGGIIMSAGIAIILLASLKGLALIGFALAGLGAANLVPIVFSAAGRQKVMPAGLAVASVTTTGYAGILLGPALIGFTADVTSLPSAFWLLAVLVLIVPATARRVAAI